MPTELSYTTKKVCLSESAWLTQQSSETDNTSQPVQDKQQSVRARLSHAGMAVNTGIYLHELITNTAL